MAFDEWMLTVAPGHKPSDDSVSLRILRKCWAAAEAAERERCAKLCKRPAGCLNPRQLAVVDEIKAAILRGA